MIEMIELPFKLISEEQTIHAADLRWLWSQLPFLLLNTWGGLPGGLYSSLYRYNSTPTSTILRQENVK